MLGLRLRYIFLFMTGLCVVGCKQSDTQETSVKQVKKMPSVSTPSALVPRQSEKNVLLLDAEYNGVKGIAAEWVDLIPKNELEILLNPPEYLEEIIDGTTEDQLEGKLSNTVTEDDLLLTDYEKVLVSTNIIEELDEVIIRIPGFVVPIEISESQIITAFFIVPYFGACMHLPPPPPNQIIYAQVKDGMRVDLLFDPIWVTGKLLTSLTENGMATSAYSMEIYSIETYEEPDYTAN